MQKIVGVVLSLRKVLCTVLPIFLCFLVALLFSWWSNRQHRQVITQLQNKYIEDAARIERHYLQKLPIYSDYITPSIEKELRRYLLPDHLKVVRKRQAQPINNEVELQQSIDKGRLVPISAKFEPFAFFYNVSKKYRYLSPHSQKLLLELGQRFQKILADKQSYKHVKFAISSVVRPVHYQNKLRDRNPNASFISSHSYGESVDIFWDEYYVVLSEVPAELTSSQLDFANKLRRKLGFLMGQALRRQFQAVLSEAILQLQAEKKLYAVLERKQRCYHITAL